MHDLGLQRLRTVITVNESYCPSGSGAEFSPPIPASGHPENTPGQEDTGSGGVELKVIRTSGWLWVPFRRLSGAGRCRRPGSPEQAALGETDPVTRAVDPLEAGLAQKGQMHRIEPDRTMGFRDQILRVPS